MEEAVKVVVKWSGKEYEITDLTQSDTVEKLKDAIFRETGVRPPRQKLLNLKHKGKIKCYNVNETFNCRMRWR